MIRRFFFQRLLSYDKHMVKVCVVLDFDAFFLVEFAQICIFIEVQSKIGRRGVLRIHVWQGIALKHELGEFLLGTIEHDSRIRFVDDFCRVSEVHSELC